MIMSSATMDAKRYGNEGVEHPRKENEFKSRKRLRSQMINEIISAEVENVHDTPRKTDSPQRAFNDKNCLNESINSPQKNRYLFNQKDLSRSPLFKSPVFKSMNRTQMDTSPQRKRTVSMNSDYDTFKLELHNTENVNNFEGIDLLHDLDSVIKFEDGKDTLLSTMMDVSTLEEDDCLSEVNKDPATDPLSISDCEMEASETAASSNSKRKRNVKIKLKPKTRRQSSRIKLNTERHKLNMEEESLLKELENYEERENMPLSAIQVSFKLLYFVHFVYYILYI